MNKNFTIPAFAEPITGLPDTPTCAAAELKRRFQAPADEVRAAHNALAEAHETLDEKVAGIIAETFEGVIDKTMLAPELADELDAKATQNALSSEETARKNADNALSSRVSSLEESVPKRARLAYGTYDGDDTDGRTFTLGFKPYFVIISCQYFVQFELPNVSLKTRQSDPFRLGDSHLTSTGFTVSKSDCISGALNSNPNHSEYSYQYVAFGL